MPPPGPPPPFGRRFAPSKRRQGEFKLDSPNVRHTKLAGGVWDLYEEVNPALAYVPGASRLELYKEMLNSLPHVWRMVKEVASIRSCWGLFVIYLTLELVNALLPAVNIRYSGQLLHVVQRAVDERTVDRSMLLSIAAARLASSMAEKFVGWLKLRVSQPLNRRIKMHYSVHIFHANARLDVPTFDDPQVQQQLEQATPRSSQRSSVAWDSISMLIGLFGTLVQLGSQLVVLGNVLREQRDGPLLAGLTLVHSLFFWMTGRRMMMGFMGLNGVWAATTRNEDYVRMEGLKKTVTTQSHRKEIVAGGDMWQFLVSEYQRAVDLLGEHATDFWSAFQNHRRERFSWTSFISDPLKELPQIVFTLRAVQFPASVPVSLASLHLINQATERFSVHIFQFFDETGSIADMFASVRKLYEIGFIENKIPDGRIPYPENTQTVNTGISLEFRNVSFKYPGSNAYALRDVSFSIKQGELCVIVGANGSGKSTILKLITRIYDPQEGSILIDGQDIKTLRLEDLRKSIACLFQDYTHFPLDIKLNIGIGDPSNAHDLDRIQEAAKLGGADGFIEKLADGYDTYLQRPVTDHYSGLPEGTEQLFGRKVDHSGIKRRGGFSGTQSSQLSGGQMQRIALARSFMKSLVSDPGHAVGLLLFDEPSASLDPKAEHDLFQRLRQLRGNKTMLFSSHRFGNLTRHSDIILYMDDSRIVESGTHEELVAKGGSYAEIWQLSVASFMD